MKKLIFKFFLISLFTCLSFFSIDKVYAVTLVTSDDWPSHTWGKYNGSWVDTYVTVTHETFYGINYYVQNTVSNYSDYRFVWYANPSTDNKPYDMFFQIALPGSRGAQVTANNNACQVSPAGVYSNSNDGLSDRRFSYIYNVECLNRYSNDNIDISIIPSWYIDKSSPYQVGISRIYYVDSLTSLNENFNLILSAIRNTDTGLGEKLDESNKIAKDQLEQDKKQHEDIMNDDTSGANSEAESFFSGFSTDTHGLTSIITAPLTLIGNITSSTCSPMALKVPFVEDQTLNLPCMSGIYKKHFGSLLNVYQIATFGLVAYWVCVRIFALVKDFKNPDHDEVEVMDL